MCRPGCRSSWQNFFHVAISSKVGDEDISIVLDRNVSHISCGFCILAEAGKSLLLLCHLPAFWLDPPRAAGRPTWRNFTSKSTDIESLSSLRLPRRYLSLARPISWSSSLIWWRIGFSAPLPLQALLLAESYLFRNFGNICPPYPSHNLLLFILFGTRQQVLLFVQWFLGRAGQSRPWTKSF